MKRFKNTSPYLGNLLDTLDYKAHVTDTGFVGDEWCSPAQILPKQFSSVEVITDDGVLAGGLCDSAE